MLESHDIFFMEVIGPYRVCNHILISLPNSNSRSTHVNF
jgi:hypothetical protein